MTSTHLLTIIASAAVIASTAAVARPVQAQAGQAQTRPTLRVVPNRSLPGQEAYRWQYFSDSRAVHAVVISPLGEYFLSLGDGPKQITGPTHQVLNAQPSQN